MTILPAMPGALRQRSFNSAMRFVCWWWSWLDLPLLVRRLIATCKRGIALLKPGIAKGALQKTNKKRARTEGISTVFFASQNKQVQKSIEIPRRRLLQFSVRAIHWRVSGKVLLSSRF
jgi:hypothetical protein